MLIQKKMYAGINRNYAMGNNANYKNEAISAAKLQAKVIGESFAKDLGKSAALTKSLSVVAQTLPLDKDQFIKNLAPLIASGSGIAGGGIWPEPNMLDA